MGTLGLNMSRLYKCDAKTLFQAVAEGALFKFTGTVMDKSNFDFRVGGKLHLDWAEDCGPVDGEFTKISEYSQIAFTWNNSASNLNTLVNINITEHDGKSTLTLEHTGFADSEQVEDHNEGWDDALLDLRKSFNDFIAKLEENNTGLHLQVRMKSLIKAPVAKVFDAVKDPEKLAEYFVESSGPFAQGSTIDWDFKGHPTFKLYVHEVIDNQLIKFRWDDSHVCMSFRKKSEGETEVVLECTGWKASQEGLNESYSECEGWRDFLNSLAHYVA